MLMLLRHRFVLRITGVLLFTAVPSMLGLPSPALTQQPQPNPRPPKLYALLLIDTNSNLRESLEVDRNNVRRVLEEGFSTRPHRLVLDVLEGDQATPDNVLRH